MNAGHRSIGEVLSLLSTEHPDLTISKIRFLESQGLISPQRTPSGYRKFFETDIERLNWILVQQRDHFLPLKEIKRRLIAGEVPPAALRGAAPRSDGPPGTPSLFASRDDEDGGEAESETTEGSVESGEDTLTLTAEELAHAAGSDLDHIYELQRLGLIAPVSGSHGPATEAIFHQEALLVARTVAALAEHGLPARNLRMFKVAADREAGVYEQLLGPLKARGASARLHSELAEILELTESLHRLLLRRLLRPHLD